MGSTGLKATYYGKPGHEHRITGTLHTDGIAASKQLQEAEAGVKADKADMGNRSQDPGGYWLA